MLSQLGYTIDKTDEFKYRLLNKNGDGIIKLIIPAAYEYDGNYYRITGIADDTFQKTKDLKKVIIPEGVTRIGGEAFSQCYDLTSVTLPNTLEYIGVKHFINAVN